MYQSEALATLQNPRKSCYLSCRAGNAGRVSRRILGRGGYQEDSGEEDSGEEDGARRKAKATPPRQQLLPNMSQLVKEAEIEAVQGVEGGGVAR